MNEAVNDEDRISAPATRRQVLAAGVAVLGLPALAAVALTPPRAALRLGFAQPSDATAFISGSAARAIGRAGVAVDRVWLASYGAIADHLCVGTSGGGVDAGIMPAAAAERLACGSQIILLSRLAGGRPSVLVAREGFQADQHGRARLALSSPAHFDVLRRHWPAPMIQQVVLPAPQIALNLRAGMIDLALLSEAAVRPILEPGLVRIVRRLPEPELGAALVLRKDWAAAHRSVALALREALASARLAS